MAGNARFHNKLHRKNHHTVASVGYPDSATDPIASPQEPFQGDFVINGTLSCTGFQVNSADFSGNVKCENLTVRGTTLCNFISGTDTETIISDGALTGYGPYTLTMDYRYGVYSKSPLFVVTGILSSLSSVSISKDLSVNNNVEIKGSSTIYGDLLINGNLSALGDYTIIETTISTTSALSVVNAGSNTALTVNQIGDKPSATFFNNSTKILEISSNGINISGDGIFTGNINAINTNILQTTSSKWDNAYNNLTANSANWNNSYINLNQLSSSWEGTKTIVNSISSNWSNTYSTVNSISSRWVNTYNTVSSNSANWSNTYNTVNSTSANWSSTYNTVNSTSGNWVDTYNTVSSNSANWSSTYNTVNSTSGNWVDTYNTVSSNSANWSSTYNTVNSTSGNWVDTYNTVHSNSADWLSGNNTLSFVASTANFNNKLTTKSIKIESNMYAAILSATLSADYSLPIDAGTYLFINCNGVSRKLELPFVNSEHRGLMYMIKNTSPTNVDLHIHYNGGLAQPELANISYGTYKRIFASGQTNNWFIL